MNVNNDSENKKNKEKEQEAMLGMLQRHTSVLYGRTVQRRTNPNQATCPFILLALNESDHACPTPLPKPLLSDSSPPLLYRYLRCRSARNNPCGIMLNPCPTLCKTENEPWYKGTLPLHLLPVRVFG